MEQNMDMVDTIEQLSGYTGAYLLSKANKETRPLFFKAYQSKSDALYKIASIIAAPILLSATSVVFLVNAGLELFSTLVNLCKLDLNKAAPHGKSASQSLLKAFFIICAAIVSPVVNLVDAAGSTITNCFLENRAPAPI
jgi:hypothetical protein